MSLTYTDEPLKHVDKRLFANAESVSEGIDQGLLKIIGTGKTTSNLFLDALDEIKMSLRPSFMLLVNLWTLDNPNSSVLISTRPLVTSIRYPTNLQTVIELREML